MLKLMIRPDLRAFMPGAYGFGEIENGMEVAVEHLVPALDRFVEQVHTMVGAGAVDERVDTSPLLLDLGREATRCLGV